jgi:cytoplasmic iron level regulating protein YaaA (DUF328/UPF0246 family)
MGKTVALVSCVSEKNNQALPARELYCSDWFIKASRYAMQISDEWYILSAKHGLLSPNKVIDPYNQTLKSMSSKSRRAWAKKVYGELQKILNPGDQVVFLAGETYREHLSDMARKMGCNVNIPMEGLRIGEQLKWLKEHLQDEYG